MTEEPTPIEKSESHQSQRPPTTERLREELSEVLGFTDRERAGQIP